MLIFIYNNYEATYSRLEGGDYVEYVNRLIDSKETKDCYVCKKGTTLESYYFGDSVCSSTCLEILKDSRL